jgi:hypothetical protein
MADVAFFPMAHLGGDECSAEGAFLHPDKRLSERFRRQSQTIPKEVVPTPEKFVVEGKEEADAALTASVTSTSSGDSVHSEFSENTAGSKFLVKNP